MIRDWKRYLDCFLDNHNQIFSNYADHNRFRQHERFLTDSTLITASTLTRASGFVENV